MKIKNETVSDLNIQYKTSPQDDDVYMVRLMGVKDVKMHDEQFSCTKNNFAKVIIKKILEDIKNVEKGI